MFFKKSHSAQEIEASVLEALPLPQSEEEGIEIALQSLAESAEIFEAMNLPDEAEVITQFMETIASGQFAMVKEAKKKAKKKSKTKTKKTKKKSPELSSDKQLDNLAHIGWVFNAPKSDCGECNMDDDGAINAEVVDPPHQYESHEKNQHGFSLEDSIRNKENRGAHKQDEKPLDYEKCKECGYDHTHEPEEAFNAHFPSKADEEFENQFSLDTIDVNNADGHANDNDTLLDEYFPDLTGPKSEVGSKVEVLPEEDEEEYLLNSIDV
jgi:hypothetical protein